MQGNAGSRGSAYAAIPGARLTLWTLLAVNMLNFLDRQIVNILAEPIKLDLGLSDTQVGLLTGLAFSLFYAVLGIPIARYADAPSTNRVTLISGALAIWSGMTALCGLAQSYVQLVLARIGVGVGEAGCVPPAHSLISEIFPWERRASAMAFFGLGVPIGSLIGMIVGGLLNDSFGWRVAFMAVSLPGLLLALGLRLVLREPRRQRLLAQAGRPLSEVPRRLGTREALREVFGSRTFLMLVAGASLTAFLAYGKVVWAVVLFQRSHGLSASETGIYLGITLGVAGLIGIWFGGYFADRFGKVDRRYILSGPALAMIVAAPLLFLAYRVNEWHVALALLILPSALNSIWYGPLNACVQGLVGPEARATASAVLLFVQNLVGLGLGPLVFGIMSDAFRPMAGAESVRWVLYGAAWLGLVPAILFWRASLRLDADLKTDQ